MKKKVGVYCRLSEEDRIKDHISDESESIQNQRNMLLKYVYDNEWDLYDVYVDEDYSGAGVERPDFNRLIADCENGNVNIVICKTQSRFSRDMEVIEKYLHNKFVEWRVRFISLLDNADTDNKGNKKARQINGLTNEWYLEDLSENIKGTLLSKKKRGEFTGSFAPLGYMKDPVDKNHLVIDPIASKYINKIFNLYKQGYGYQKIVKQLNKEEIPSPYEYKKMTGSNFKVINCKQKSSWSIDTISKILRDEVYIGNLVQGKTRHISYKNKKSIKVPKDEWIKVENTHDKIIDLETWNIVQLRLGKNLKTQKGTEKVHIFSGKVYCEKCGKIFCKNTGLTSTGKVHYLECKSRRNGHRDCNNTRAIRFDYLEKCIIDSMNCLLKQYYNESLLNDNYKNLKSKSNQTFLKIEILQKEQNVIQNQKEKKQRYYEKLYEDRVDEVITDKEFRDFRKKYSEEIEKLENRLFQINKEIEELSQKKQNIKSQDKILSKYKHIDKLNREIIDEFIDRILVGGFDEETGQRYLTIEWNFEFYE